MNFKLRITDTDMGTSTNMDMSTEEDKIWLDGSVVMGLMDPVPRANEERAQCSLKPITGRYSKSPGYRVLAAYA